MRNPHDPITRLLDLESLIRYHTSPPPGQPSYLIRMANSPVLLSAPHGAVSYRGKPDETWHEEDEFTGGMALLLAEICSTSAIVNAWRSDESDGNHHSAADSPYKRALGEIVQAGQVRWVIDLHGAGATTSRMGPEQWVDLGLGCNQDYLPAAERAYLVACLERHLYPGVAERGDRKGFAAAGDGTIAAFARTIRTPFGDAAGAAALAGSVQIEMKPCLRVVRRREDASLYRRSQDKNGGPYSAPPEKLAAMIQALMEFIEHLKTKPSTSWG